MIDGKRKSLLHRTVSSYRDAARSRAGVGMLLVTIFLSTAVFSLHGLSRALTSGSLLYLFLVSTLAIGRKGE
jgi:hypothetical protein